MHHTLLTQPAFAPVTWTGASGKTYEFQLHPIGTDYYGRPGVYIFCAQVPSGMWNALYIGETDSF